MHSKKLNFRNKPQDKRKKYLTRQIQPTPKIGAADLRRYEAKGD